jgi:hypothetical protein
MAVTDQRMTVLEIINEVRLKSKLNSVSTITQDSDSVIKLAYLNDTVSEISDYGNWQESLRQITVTAQSSVADYSISSAAFTQLGIRVIQNIHEVVFETYSSEMSKIELDQLRRLQRLSNYGNPTQWAVKGVDTDGNPIISVAPIPATNQDGKIFTINLYEKPAFYTTADATTVVPFPGDLITQGVLAKSILDESDGDPTPRYQMTQKVYEDALNQAYNRYNGDTGSTVYFRPGRGRR